MQADKEIGLALIDVMEDLFLRLVAHETLLDELAPGWKQSFDRALTQDHRDQIHKQLMPVRERMLDAPDLTAVVIDILKTIENEGEGRTL